jgi:hypothetical protein
VRWLIPRAETLPQRRAEVVPTGTQRYWAGTKGVLGGYSSAAADGSAWTTVVSKAGGATVRARVRACAYRGERVREHGGVQFYGNADPQNKVTNEFAAPVLARSAVLLDGVL